MSDLIHTQTTSDKKRIPKSLHTSHALGTTPFLSSFTNEKDESDFIANEIKRCVANMGGVLKWGDFAILRTPTWFVCCWISYIFNTVRFNALSRAIENALQKQGIPCKILGGHKFFERMEVRNACFKNFSWSLIRLIGQRHLGILAAGR